MNQQLSQQFIALHNKSILGMIDSLRDKELMFKKQQISTMKNDIPKSFPKLMRKQIFSKQLVLQSSNKLNDKSSHHTIQFKTKLNQKSYYRALQEQHKLINRQNMQLLGLTIQRANIAKKNNKKNIPIQDYLQEFPTPQQMQVLNLQNNQLFIQNQNKSKIFYHKKSACNSPQKRPHSIRVRSSLKQNVIEKKRKSNIRQVNPEYQNPIYDARILSYRQLLYKLQWTYGFCMSMDKQQLKSDQKYKVWIGNGNNSYLVKDLMKRRFWWQIIQQRNLEVNFMWTQLKNTDYFQKQANGSLCLQKKKQQQKQNEIQTRQNSLKKKTLKQRQKQKQYLKNQQYLYKLMSPFQIKQFISTNRHLYSKDVQEKQEILNLREDQNSHQKMHNHLTANFHLGNKKALFYNLKQYYQLSGGNLFKAVPLTFHIKKGLKDPQYKRFVAYHKKRQAHIKKQQKLQQKGQNPGKPMRNIWIVKPGQLTNRGNGITVIDQIYEFDAIVKSQKKHQNGAEKTFIVQLYIDRPFLYKKRKFDIRHYMMISQIHGVFKAYWFKQGYIRTSSYQFDVHNFQRQIHLTNDAVQKYCPLYGKYESANKISYAQFQKYLDSNYPKQKYSFQDQILTRMKQIARDTVRSTYVKISPQRKKHNFQIFGLDFMIDSQFTPWLIEVNTNPCLQLACPLLARIIPQMLDQALRLTLDVIYPPPIHYPNTSKHLVPEASLQNLRWQLFFDERMQGQNLRQLYRKCKSNVLADIGNVSDDEVYEDSNNNNNNTQIYELL